MSSFRIKNVFKASVFFVFLMFGLFAPKVFGDTNVANAGGGTFVADMKTKMLLVNDIYYWTFTNNDGTGNYKMFVGTSTASNVITSGGGSFSTIQPVIDYGIFAHNYNGDTLNGLYAFEYNSFGGYFGAAIYASGTQEIWYTTSTNAVNWSPTTTVADGLSFGISARRKLSLSYLSGEEMAVIFFESNNGIKVATSTGGAWVVSSELIGTNSMVFSGGGLSGSVANPVYHVGYYDTTSTASIVYASSTDFGATWTTSTVDNDLTTYFSSLDYHLGFPHLTSFALNSNSPAFVYYKVTTGTILGDPMPIMTTSSLVFTQLNNAGTWVSSTISTAIPWTLNSITLNPSELIFFNSSTIVSVPGDNFEPTIAYSTTTDVWGGDFSYPVTLGYSSDMSSAYDSTNNILTTIYFSTIDGVTSTPTIVTSSVTLPEPVVNSAPSVTAISPVFSSNVTGLVTVTTTVSDANADTVNLTVQYSLDSGATWTSSTLGTVTAGNGSPATTTGAITGITTASGNALEFTWNTFADGISTNVTALLRITPNDGTVNGTTQTSSAFAVNDYNGNLPVINADSKNKLLLVNGVYNLSFTSSTADGYHLYFTTSTNGAAGSWSQPVDVFSHGIYPDQSNDRTTNGLFAMDYNTQGGGYFATAIYATGTTGMWFASSTNGVVWATSTIVSDLSMSTSSKRRLTMDTSGSENLITIFYNDNNNGDNTNINVVTSSNNGVNWSKGNSVTTQGELVGGRVSGSGLSRIFHYGYLITSGGDPEVGMLKYVTSSDGVSWVSSTVAAANFSGPPELSYPFLVGFDLDSNAVPGFTFYYPSVITQIGESNVYNTTSSLVYVKGNGSGGWNASTTIANDIHWQITGLSQEAAYLFYNGTTPVFAGANTEFGFGYKANTSTWVTGSIDNSLSQSASVSAVYNSSTLVLATSYVLSNGVLTFTTSSLDLTVSPPNEAVAPTISSVDQNTTSSMRINWTQGDGGDETEFVVQVSEDGGSTYSTVSTTPTTTLSFVVDALITPNTQYFFRVIASTTDSQATSVVVSGYTSSTDPVALLVSAVSTSSLTLTWGENNNPTTTIYRISGGETVVTTTATTTELSVLPNKVYTFVVRSLNNDDSANSAVAADATTTMAAIPGTPVAVANGQTSVTVSWSNNNNVSGTVYRLYNITTDSIVSSTLTSTSTTVTGLTAGTAYQFNVKAQYQSDDSTWTATSSDSIAVSTAAVASTVTISLPVGVSSTFQLSAGGTVHTATLNSIADGEASVTVESNPVTVSLGAGESDNIDTSGDGTDDTTVTMVSVGASSAQFTLASYTPPVTPVSSGGGGSNNVPIIPAVATTTLATSTVATTTISTTTVQLPSTSSTVSLPVVQAFASVFDPDSKVVIKEPIKYSYQPNTKFVFNYQFKNESKKAEMIKIVRQLIDSKGEAVMTKRANINVKAGKVFVGKVDDTITKTLSPGVYIERIQIMDLKNKLIAENSFEIQVEKLKVKYLLIDKEVTVDSKIKFDSKVLAKTKSNVKLPKTVQVKYTYLNDSKAKQKVKMVRELVGSNGKVLQSKVGKWTVPAGKLDLNTFVQNIDPKLAQGNYEIRVRAYDQINNQLLGENSLGFKVELR